MENSLNPGLQLKLLKTVKLGAKTFEKKEEEKKKIQKKTGHVSTATRTQQSEFSPSLSSSSASGKYEKNVVRASSSESVFDWIRLPVCCAAML